MQGIINTLGAIWDWVVWLWQHLTKIFSFWWAKTLAIVATIIAYKELILDTVASWFYYLAGLFDSITGVDVPPFPVLVTEVFEFVNSFLPLAELFDVVLVFLALLAILFFIRAAFALVRLLFSFL